MSAKPKKRKAAQADVRKASCAQHLSFASKAARLSWRCLVVSMALNVFFAVAIFIFTTYGVIKPVGYVAATNNLRLTVMEPVFKR